MKLRNARGKRNPLVLSSSHYAFFALSLLAIFSFPQYSLAQDAVRTSALPALQDVAFATQQEEALYASAHLTIPTPPVVRIVSAHSKSGQMWIVITAYSSTPDQTDSTPFITATGDQVHDGIIAANFLPFGTKVRFPTLYGNKVFVVDDRMNGRYWYHADIWMQARQDAKDFGVHIAPMEIVL